jgi:trehalose 6-phosphate phosphatase
MLKTLSLPRVSDLGPVALFLDLDGTLVEITEKPHQVRVDPETIALLGGLSRRLDGALAIVSGRAIEDIDRIFHPLVLPAAGVHGLMRRNAAGRIESTRIDPAAVEPVKKALEQALGPALGVLIEEKPGAIAVHYRSRPDLEEVCFEAANAAARRGGLELIRGKMVFEVKVKGASKGTAIDAFLREAPFRGRVPVFAGDDVTDEDGFAVVDAAGGHSIKVGNGTSRARWHTGSTAELIGWLGELAAGGA